MHTVFILIDLWEPSHDEIIIMLICRPTVVLMCNKEFPEDGEDRMHGWVEPVHMHPKVWIVIYAATMLDYERKRFSVNLSKEVALSNQHFVIQGGTQLQLVDDQVNVGDVILLDVHTAVMTSVDGVLLSGESVMVDDLSRRETEARLHP